MSLPCLPGLTHPFNPFTADPGNALHFAILVLPTIFNFWHLGALALSPERQSARMSKIKNGGLDQYGAEPFEQHKFGTAGVEGVNFSIFGHSGTNEWAPECLNVEKLKRSEHFEM